LSITLNILITSFRVYCASQKKSLRVRQPTDEAISNLVRMLIIRLPHPDEPYYQPMKSGFAMTTAERTNNLRGGKKAHANRPMSG